MKKLIFFLLVSACIGAFAQTDQRIYDIIEAVSAERIKADVTQLTNFGTRHSLSDTVSQTRGIGAARRWIKSEFEKTSSACNGCLNVLY
ncbi:MAG: peptidase M28, partial [Flavobacteriaceae bacterium]